MKSNLLPSGFSHSSSLTMRTMSSTSPSTFPSLTEHTASKCPIRGTKGTFVSASATERAAYKLAAVGCHPITSLLVKNVPSRQFGTRSVGRRYASVGASSLLALEAQILTLKETIMFLQPMFKDKDNQEASMTKGPNSITELSTHGFKSNGAELDSNLEVSANDFIKLQEEYNKLILTKHQV